MSSKPILFYSRRCKHCINLWNQLNKTKKLNLIIKIDVDKKQNVPKYIKTVPTLLVKGRPLMIGDSINLFLNNYGINKTTKTNNESKDNNESGIQDYMPSEMGSFWSDSYSYINNENPINHSYSFLNSDNTEPPKITNVDNTKYTEKNKRATIDISQRLEEFKNSRDNDITFSRKI